MKPPPVSPADPHDSLPADDPRRSLSALVDGQADALPQACSLWRDDAEARRSWHTYHLIGDVLRSEELARPPQRDADFLAALREKLAAEPVPLAPSPAPAAPAPAPALVARRRQAWLMPMAAAAGFVVVAGVLVVTRLSQPGADAPSAVLAGAPGAGLTVVGTAVGTVSRPVPAATAPGAGFIRDPQLDEYLRAHQAAGGGVAAAAPGGTLRRVGVAAPGGAIR